MNSFENTEYVRFSNRPVGVKRCQTTRRLPSSPRPRASTSPMPAGCCALASLHPPSWAQSSMAGTTRT